MLQIDLWKRVLIWTVCALGLLLAMPNVFYQRVEARNDAVAAIELGNSGNGLEAQAAMWPSFLPSGLVNLGLDLRGGAHLLAEVQVADVYESRMKSMWPEIRDMLREERATIGTIRLQPSQNDQLRIRISKPEQISRAAGDGPQALPRRRLAAGFCHFGAACSAALGSGAGAGWRVRWHR